MEISIIIPIYNAAPYVRQAVESALEQPETGEVVLVEDGSTDHSLQVCEALAAEYPEVRLYRHPNGGNCGAAASRNLGLEKSCCEYIAFLDADDFYLPGRFSEAARLFELYPDVEGVYEAVGSYFETDEDLQRWEFVGGFGANQLRTMTTRVPPEQLFEALMEKKSGFFHLSDATVLKRTVFEKTGVFSEHIKAGEDTALVRKLAATAKLIPGRLDQPVAMVRIHAANSASGSIRSPREIQRWRYISWKDVWVWGEDHLSPGQKRILLAQFLRYLNGGIRRGSLYQKWAYFWRGRAQLVRLLLDIPSVGFYWQYWKQYPPRIDGVRHYGKLLLQKINRKNQGASP
jgi:glycosyltransferase involved in cell wall biosynthesis